MIDIVKCTKERRGKIVAITTDAMIAHFQPVKEGYLRLPQIVGIPEDAFVSRVSLNVNMDCFCFLMLHPSFAKVEAKDAYPYAMVENRLIEISNLFSSLTYDRPERLDNPDNPNFVQSQVMDGRKLSHTLTEEDLTDD